MAEGYGMHVSQKCFCDLGLGLVPLHLLGVFGGVVGFVPYVPRELLGFKRMVSLCALSGDCFIWCLHSPWSNQLWEEQTASPASLRDQTLLLA